MIWYLLTRYPVKIVVTAPTSSQLFDALFAELKAWINKLPKPIFELLEIKQDKIELKAAASEAFISARTSRAENPESLQGIHCFASGTVDVLTRRGWIPLEDVTLDDEVLSKQIGSRQAHWERPTDVIHAPYSGPMHHYKSRMLTYTVTPGHRFELEKRVCGRLGERWDRGVWQAEDMLPGQMYRIPKTFDAPYVDEFPYVIPSYMSRRYGKPLACVISGSNLVSAYRDEIEVEAGDWAELIGWCLAEGSISRRDGKPIVVAIGQSREKNWAKYSRISALIDRLGFVPVHTEKSVNICNVQVAKHIDDLCPGHSAEKRVPEFAFELPPHIIRRMLDGFRLGDGHGDYEYYTSSPGLADDIQRLILLSGGYATINKFDRKGTIATGFKSGKTGIRKSDYFRIKEWRTRSVDTSLIRPELRSVVDFDGMVSCLTMPSGMFYVRDRQTTQGLWTHNSQNVLLIADEASGVPEAVFEAAAGSMSGHNACTILLGNPTRSSGYFFDTHNKNRDKWWTRRVSCVDSPRVSKEFVEEMRETYGEESNAFRVRVLGEFPLSDDDTVIPIDLALSAQHRDIVERPGVVPIWGLDVARFGTDSSVLAKRFGSVIRPLSVWRGLDTMQLSGAIVAEYEQTPHPERPEIIIVDVIGIGAGVVDRLREIGLPVRGLNVSEAPSVKGRHHNLRSELWFATKAWLELRDSKLPMDEHLIAEMAAPRYSFTSSGKLLVESKENMKKRGLKSPDRADAVCLTMAGQASSVAYGSTGKNRGKPLKRNLKGVA